MNPKEVVFQARYFVHAEEINHIDELQSLIRQIMNRNSFQRSNQPAPFQQDFSSSLEYVSSYQEYSLPLKKRVASFFGGFSEVDKERHSYYESLRARRPESVQRVTISFNSVEFEGESGYEIKIRTEPALIHQVDQLGYSYEQIPDWKILRIQDKHTSFIENKFRPIASQIISSASPKKIPKNPELQIPESLVNSLPTEVYDLLNEASGCYEEGYITASGAMLARAFEEALAIKIEDEENQGEIIHKTNEQGRKYFADINSLHSKISGKHDIPSRLVENFEMDWFRRASVHYSDGYKLREGRVENAFDFVIEYLENIY